MVDITPKVQRNEREQHAHVRGPHGSKQRPDDLTRPTHVRVVATDEKYRRVLKHGISGKRFMSDINQAVEWPFDSFTRRCMKDGSVRIVEDVSAAAAAAPQREQSRQQPRQQPARPAPKHE